MNLMFRKNFRESGSGSSGTKSTKMSKMNRGGKRQRDMSISNTANDDSFSTQYRTHLFFNARGAGSGFDETGLMNFSFLLIFLIILLMPN
jgi:hypothetical protein